MNVNYTFQYNFKEQTDSEKLGFNLFVYKVGPVELMNQFQLVNNQLWIQSNFDGCEMGVVTF